MALYKSCMVLLHGTAEYRGAPGGSESTCDETAYARASWKYVEAKTILTALHS